MIDTVFFDLDGTLLDFSKAERNALTETLIHFGIAPREQTLLRYSQLNQQQWELLEQGRITRQQLKIRRYQLLFCELGVDCSAQEATGYYEPRLAMGFDLIKGAEGLLEQLAPKYRLYGMTNGSAATQKSRIAGSGLDRFFREVFISEEVGEAKPHPAFFSRCFERIPQFEKERAVLVGDSLTSDILGGVNAGLRTVWFNPKGAAGRQDIRADHEVRALSQLPALLDRL